MNNSDPTSLANLNDIVLTPPNGWWPLATGWYGLAAVLLAVISWLVFRSFLRYRRNRYRRAALSELEKIRADCGKPGASLLPALLKRTALHVWPRDQVAALNGEEWRQFMDQHCESRPFAGSAGNLLTTLTYNPDEINETDRQLLIKSARVWIQQHRVKPC
jgi:hypothetical protein